MSVESPGYCPWCRAKVQFELQSDYRWMCPRCGRARTTLIQVAAPASKIRVQLVGVTDPLLRDFFRRLL